MKDEIEKILDDTLRSFDEIEDIPEAADKISQLVKSKIDSIPLIELAEVFDKYKIEHPSGQGHIFHDLFFISIVQDIINIIKERCK